MAIFNKGEIAIFREYSMRYAVVIFVFIFSFSAGLVYAKKESNLAPRGKWQSYFKKNLSSVFCHDRGYFRSCFPIDLNECKVSVIKSSHSCFSSMRVPNEIDINKHGIYFGSKIGYCVGQKLEIDLASRKSRDTKCIDPRKWL